MNIEELNKEIKKLNKEITKIHRDCEPTENKITAIKQKSYQVYSKHCRNIERLKELKIQINNRIMNNKNADSLVTEVARLNVLIDVPIKSIQERIESKIPQLKTSINYLKQPIKDIEKRIKTINVAIELRAKMDGGLNVHRAAEEMIYERKFALIDADEYQELVA